MKLVNNTHFLSRLIIFYQTDLFNPFIDQRNMFYKPKKTHEKESRKT